MPACLHGIEFLGILRKVFLSAIEVEETRVKVHKWLWINFSVLMENELRLIENQCSAIARLSKILGGNTNSPHDDAAVFYFQEAQRLHS